MVSPCTGDDNDIRKAPGRLIKHAFERSLKHAFYVGSVVVLLSNILKMGVIILRGKHSIKNNVNHISKVKIQLVIRFPKCPVICFTNFHIVKHQDVTFYVFDDAS